MSIDKESMTFVIEGLFIIYSSIALIRPEIIINALFRNQELSENRYIVRIFRIFSGLGLLGILIAVVSKVLEKAK